MPVNLTTEMLAPRASGITSRDGPTFTFCFKKNILFMIQATNTFFKNNQNPASFQSNAV